MKYDITQDTDVGNTVLDHGYLKYIEHWGSDARIVESARMSTDKGFLGWGPIDCSECNSDGREYYNNSTSKDFLCRKCSGYGKVAGDERLLHYLWKNAHHSPFEMAGMTIEVMAPIMVFREWVRHRVPFGYNELSARYTPLPNCNYTPTVDRLLRKDESNHQAGTVKGSHTLDSDSAREWIEELYEVYEHCEKVYQNGLRRGVSKELARLCVPVGRYSRMRITSNLRGWLAFLTLRMASNAQEEIRVYATVLADLLKVYFPRTLEVYMENRR